MAKYSEKIVDKICELVATGDNRIIDICKRVGISEPTFYEWKNSKPKFLESLKKAEESRLEAFKYMARSGLAKLLDVFEYDELHTEHTHFKGVPITNIKTITKKVMPNPTAVIFALTNRDSANFKHLQHIDHTSDGEKVTGFNYIKPNGAERPADKETG